MTDFHIRVTPKASSNRIVVATQSDGKIVYRIYVTTVPEDGKANEAVLKLLAAHLNVPKSLLSIVKGATSRNKIVSLHR